VLKTIIPDVLVIKTEVLGRQRWRGF